ncbi:response regulator transcription factor [Lysinibacillus endophyticus]|uniref:response regulator transcription factor n=1 Tax=Ureibacillus endophyticus TaxID=1978490 RepID=UPI0020A0921E|nr:LuxR C-terminal-related transcriptional regulator [Lysinibacillus endophyticus]MCP1144783.1 LuxR C-terminal-related transcriptional regulator [Lysinibacillus endophyticus]
MDKELTKYIREIYNATDIEERVLIAARGFINLFPFSRVQINEYSILSGNVKGVLDVSVHGTRSLDFQDNIRDIPLLRKAIRKREAIYSTGSEYIQQSPAKYIAIDMYRSFVIIVPITSHGNVIGYACPSTIDDSVDINDALLEQLTLYGQMIGNALVTLSHLDNSHNLSKREIEILQHVSWGETVKEMSSFLQISEFTIQDYIKSAIKKLNAHNRMHAVSEALRLGIIV